MPTLKDDKPTTMSWARAIRLGLFWILTSSTLLVILAAPAILQLMGYVSPRFLAVTTTIAILAISAWGIGVPMGSSLYHKSWKLAAVFVACVTIVATIIAIPLFYVLLMAPRVWH